MPGDQIYVFFSLGITLIYVGFLLYFYYGLSSYIQPNTSTKNQQEKVSVIIAVCNEENHIGDLLECILKQEYAKDHYELILVDDHSQDLTGSLIQKFILDHPEIQIRFYLLDTEMGKKRAIQYGIKQANYNNLLFTDADCIMGPKWIQNMMNVLKSEQIKMVLGPVIIQPGKKIIGQFQSIEYFGLQSITMGSAVTGNATMANGANLLIRKECYPLVYDSTLTGSQPRQGPHPDRVPTLTGSQPRQGPHPDRAPTLTGSRFSSGDDVFLLHYVKKLFGGKSITYAAFPDAVVVTFPHLSIRSLIWQHVRWAGKFKGFKDPFTVIFGLLTATIHLLIVTLLILSFIQIHYLSWFFIVWGIKIMTEYLLIRKSSSYLNFSVKIWNYLIATMIYPLFATLIFVISLSGKYYWKGRWQR